MKAGRVEWSLVDQSPEVELIAASFTAEALEEVPAQVDREAEGIAGGDGIVNRTGAAQLLRSSCGRPEAEQLKYLRHGDAGPQKAVVDARH